jgi:hypothetical protein
VQVKEYILKYKNVSSRQGLKTQSKPCRVRGVGFVLGFLDVETFYEFNRQIRF